MHRFFIKPEFISAQRVTFPKDLTHQILHVLRLGQGDQVVVLDNCGYEHHVRLGKTLTQSNLVGEIIGTEHVANEPDVEISLYFGLSNRDKVEWIFQKGTEIGVSAFHPFYSSRTLVQKSSFTDKKLQRWESIIREAAEQSGRGLLPELYAPTDLSDSIIEAYKASALCLFAWEGVQNEGETLSDALMGFDGKTLALFVGPEGGFTDAEVKHAQDAGCLVVSLGRRILRMETAAIIFPSLVLFKLGSL